MIPKLMRIFEDFVSDCMKHLQYVSMDNFTIDINGAMKSKIDEWVKEHCIKHKNSDGEYTLGGVKITVHENFGSPFLQPEPPLIWFRYDYKHGYLCTIDENGNVVSAVGHVQCVDPEPEPVVFYDMKLQKNEK